MPRIGHDADAVGGRVGHHGGGDQRQGGPDGERQRRGEHRLHRPGQRRLGDAELLDQVGLQGVVLGELHRHLAGEVVVEALVLVDRGELGQLALGHVGQLPLLLGDVGLLGVALRAHRHVLAEAHREGAGGEPGDTGGEHGGAARVGGDDAEDQRGGGDDAVVGAEDGGPQPTGTVAEVAFLVWRHGVDPTGPSGR